jgi:hypothetical protein
VCLMSDTVESDLPLRCLPTRIIQTPVSILSSFLSLSLSTGFRFCFSLHPLFCCPFNECTLEDFGWCRHGGFPIQRIRVAKLPVHNSIVSTSLYTSWGKMQCSQHHYTATLYHYNPVRQLFNSIRLKHLQTSNSSFRVIQQKLKSEIGRATE